MDSASGFAATYGRSPDVVWSAPGRANLIGEHTDYNEGFVLPFAITERTVAAAARRGYDTITVASTSFPGRASIAGLSVRDAFTAAGLAPPRIATVTPSAGAYKEG
jgi:galactokinase